MNGKDINTTKKGVPLCLLCRQWNGGAFNLLNASDTQKIEEETLNSGSQDVEPTIKC